MELSRTAVKNRNKNFLTTEIVLLTLVSIVFSGVLGTIGAYLGILLIPLLFYKTKVLFLIDKNFFLIALFTISYTAISSIYGYNSNALGNIFFYSIYPLLFYLTGRYFIARWPIKIYFLLFLTLSSFALPIIIPTIKDIAINGFLSGTTNSGQELKINAMSTTGRAAKVSLAVAVFSVILAPKANPKERWYKLLFIIMGILGLVTVLHIVNRTGIVIFLVALLLVVLSNLMKLKFKNIFVMLIPLTIIVTIFIFPFIEKSGTIEAYMKREQNVEFGANTAGGRTELWLKGINVLYTHPMGGGGVIYGSKRDYAHNLWLDIGGVAGVIPFFTFLALTFINTRKSFVLIKSQFYFSPFLCSLIIAINCGFLLTGFVEPIIEANFWYFCGLFCFWGMTSMLYQQYKIQNRQVGQI